MSSCSLQLPPGFRFHPTDEELVIHYLCKKCADLSISVPIIAEIDLYKYDPWQLPGLALYGEKEWYFFSPRDRKYPNGSRPNRAAGSGYWKATGADKSVGTPKPVGIKKALVFYTGKAPKGEKTNWIMHEYRLANVDRSARKNNSLRLDDWVLCRVYNKKGEPGSEDRPKALQRKLSGVRDIWSGPEAFEDRKPVVLPPHLLTPVQSTRTISKQIACFGSPEFNAESSCSEHVLSPEITCDSEAHSETRWRSEWDRGLDIPPVLNEFGPGSVFPQFEPDPVSTGFRDPLQDILMYWGKPF